MSDNLAYQDEYPDGYREIWKREKLQGNLIDIDGLPLTGARTLADLCMFLRAYFDRFPAFIAAKNCPVYLTEEDWPVPDVLVCPESVIQEDGIHEVPLLIAEVLSPANVWRNRGYKKDLYERHGVKEYWLADPESLTVEQYLLRDGRYVLNNLLTQIPEWEQKWMRPEERARIPRLIRCDVFPELTLTLDDVFHYQLEELEGRQEALISSQKD